MIDEHGLGAMVPSEGRMLPRGLSTDTKTEVTRPPPPLPLIAGIQQQGAGISRGYRPSGTDDWLLVCTLEGLGYARPLSGVQQVLRRGSVFLIAPGERHDYGHLHEGGDWTNIWIHFRPRSNWVAWLEWPKVAGRLRYLEIVDDAATVESQALAIVDALKSGGSLRFERAMNNLEGLLLTCREAECQANQFGVNDNRVSRAIAYIDNHIDYHLTILDVAASVGISRSRLTTLFRHCLGLSPQAFIEQQRLNRAAGMLLGSPEAVSKIAESVGFTNPYYFSTRFRRQFGVAPSRYRLLADSVAVPTSRVALPSLSTNAYA